MSTFVWNSLAKNPPFIRAELWFFRNSENGDAYVVSFGSREIWKYSNKEFELLHSDVEINTSYLTAATCYWDPIHKCITMVLVKGYGSEIPEVHRLVKGVFKEVKLKNGSKSNSQDCVVWDPHKSRLLHVRCVHRNETGIEVSVLEGDTWRTTAKCEDFNGSMGMTAGYDEFRKTIIIINQDNDCRVLNGDTWEKLPDYPTYSWMPSHFAASPNAQHMVLMHTERSTTPSTILYELGEKSWTKKDAGATEPYDKNKVDFNHGLYFPEENHTLFLNHRPAKNRPDYLFGKYDGERILPYGPIRTPDGGLIAADGRLVAFRQAFRSDDGSAIVEFLDEAWQEVLPIDFGIHKLFVDGKTILILNLKGDVWALENKACKLLSKAHKEYEYCDGSSVTWDPQEKAIYVTGGEPKSGGKYRMDLYKFSVKSGWEKITGGGKKPAFRGADIAWDNSRNTLVLFDGRTKTMKKNEEVFEFDGKKWKTFPKKGASFKYASELTFDPTIEKIIFIADGGLYAYEGEGKFKKINTLDPDGICAYDVNTRTLYSMGKVFRSLFLGDILDETYKNVSKKVSNAKEEVKESKKTKIEKTDKNVPHISQRYLRFVEDNADKFWFAELKGKSYTLSWGKRGTKGQEKTFICANKDTAQKEFDKKVKEKIDKGYYDAPEGKNIAVIPGKTSYHWKWSKTGNDFVGGVTPNKEAPKCEECGSGMMHVFTTNTIDVLKKHGSLSAYICVNDDGGCETWEPFGGANAVVLNKETSEVLQKIWKKKKPANEETYADPGTITYTEVFEVDPESEDGEELEIEDKCGGYVTWYQGDNTPECPKCKKAMTFVAQCNEFDSVLNFGGGGVAYIFVCKDEHSGAMLWQC